MTIIKPASGQQNWDVSLNAALDALAALAGGAYVKPSSGIPLADLDAVTQARITALTSIDGGSPTSTPSVFVIDGGTL